MAFAITATYSTTAEIMSEARKREPVVLQFTRPNNNTNTNNMNRPVRFSVSEVFTIEHAGQLITGKVLERSVRRLTVQLVEPYGLLHVTKRVHPSIGGALGFEGSAGDTFKVELLVLLYERAVLLQPVVPILARAVRADRHLEERVIACLRPVIGRYAPFNFHSYALATHALEHQLVALPPLPAEGIAPHVLAWHDTKVMLYRELVGWRALA